MKQTKLNTSESFLDLLTTKGPDPGIRLELQNIKTLLAALGNPQDKIAEVVHIAGTNGKGSTLAFLAALLNQLKIKIGRYTSPHLIDVNERFTTDGLPIADERLLALSNRLAALTGQAELTFFERLTAIAFQYFHEEAVDILLLETGLGGRLDATNLVQKPSLCLITNVALDHQEFLGDTIEKIAKEKAGILKPNVPFYTTAQGEALKVIQQQAEAVGAKELPLQEFNLNTLELGLKGPHQILNAQLAANAFHFLVKEKFKNKVKLTQTDWLRPLSQTIDWPGRMQEIMFGSSKILLDGAHNEAGAKALRQALDQLETNKHRVWLLGFLGNKNYAQIIEQLLKSDDRVIFTYPSEPDKSAPISELTQIASKILPSENIYQAEEPIGAYQKLTELLIDSEQLGIVSGSLYLVGRVLEINRNCA